MSRRRYGLPRYAARVDRNQPEIVAGLRAVGATVQHLHTVGHGCPDLLVGYRGANYALEIKDGKKPPSKRRLTPDEEAWHDAWAGQVDTAETLEEALEIIGAVHPAGRGKAGQGAL